MINIILYSILFIEILLAISCAITFQGKVNDSYAVSRQYVISIAFSLQGFAYIAMLLSSSDVLSYFLYAISWYSGVVLLANFVTMAAYSMNYKSEFTKYIVSVIYYLGIIIYFVDTFVSKGTLVHENIGISYPSFTTMQIIMHALYYAIFIASMAMFFSNFSIQPRKKRDRYLLSLWVLTFSFVLIGVLFEFVELLFNIFNIPFVLLTCICSILLMPKLLIYHRSIVMSEDDYSDYLKSDTSDMVLVCDDEYNVKYMNKRSFIIGQVIKDNFLNRNLSDIFLISSENENLLYDGEKSNRISMPVIYSPLNKRLNIEIIPFYDKFNELFSAVVTISGLENSDMDVVPHEIEIKADEQTIEEEHLDDYSIANGARVLIVNENSIRINVFEKMLQPYLLTVNRAINVQMAFREIVDNTYDIIFVDQNISRISPYDFVKKIRSLEDDYYKMVPICYCTDIPMDEQYKEFFEAGFTDFLQKPLSAKQLNLVLTRWLWKRYNKEYIGNPDLISPDSDTKELRLLLQDCNMYYEKNNKLLLANCLRAIRQQCVILNLPEYEYDARALYKSVILDDLVFFEKQYNFFQSKFLSAVESIDFVNKLSEQ